MYRMLTTFCRFYFRPSPGEVERRVLALVKQAYEEVPYYRELLSDSKLTPDSFKTLEDFVTRFPVTDSGTYRELQTARPEMVISRRHRIEDLVVDRSSGSSGIPISLYKTHAEVQHNAARMVWHLVDAGLRPWNRALAIVPPIQKVERDSTLQQFGIFFRRTVDYLMPLDEVLDILEEERIDAIYGQKSHMMLLADKIEETGRYPKPLQLLAPAAEKIDAFARGRLQEVFRPKHFAEIYGSTETNIIGVKKDADYEIDYHGTFFCLDNPRKNPDGTSEGEILVTSLVLDAQPILQYRLGDTVVARNYDRLVDLEASISEVRGRTNDYLVLPNGERLSGAMFYTSLEYFPFVRQFRIVQKERASCRVMISLTEDRPSFRRQIEEAVDKVLQGRIAHSIDYVERIPPDPNGKTKILISDVT